MKSDARIQNRLYDELNNISFQKYPYSFNNNEFEIIGLLDIGIGKHCLCGKSITYITTIQHTITKRIFYIGSTCIDKIANRIESDNILELVKFIKTERKRLEKEQKEKKLIKKERKEFINKINNNHKFIFEASRFEKKGGNNYTIYLKDRADKNNSELWKLKDILQTKYKNVGIFTEKIKVVDPKGLLFRNFKTKKTWAFRVILKNKTKEAILYLEQ